MMQYSVCSPVINISVHTNGPCCVQSVHFQISTKMLKKCTNDNVGMSSSRIAVLTELL